MGYRIKTVSELVGVPKNTLVAWERRYGLVEPERLPNGYRVYSERDVAILRRLKRALDDGLKISEAVSRLREEQDEADPPASEQSLATFRERVEEALTAFDRPRAVALTKSLVGHSYPALIDELYLPLLESLGARWAAGEISVAQEHHASSFVRDQLTAMLLTLGGGPKHGPHVACTTFPGERHELALLALSVRLALAGARVTYLGSDLPVEELVRFASLHRPSFLLVSVIVKTPAAALERYATRLRRDAPRETQIVMGGSGLPAKLAVAGVRFESDWHDLEIV